MKKKLSLVTILALSGLFSVNSLSASELEINGNVGVSSNYIWRGMTQTQDDSQTSGGIDFSYDEFYFGSWVSNVDFGDDASSEVDLYVGYANDFKEITYDLTYFYYLYPSSTAELNFQELKLSLAYDIDALALGISHSIVTKLQDSSAKKLDYSEITASYDFGMLSLDSSFGDYEETGTNYLVGISKSYDLSDATLDLSVAYTNFSHDSDSTKDEENVFASATYSF